MNKEQQIEQLKREIERLERVINDQNELCWSCKKSAKETAKEILQYLYEKIDNAPLSDIELVVYLAKQYGVEVKE